MNRKTQPWVLAAIALLATAGAPAPPAASPPDPVAQLLRDRLEGAATPPAVRLHGERAKAWSALRSFYAGRGYLPAWWDRGTPRPAAQRLLDKLDELAADGLDPRLYPRAELRRLTADAGAARRPADQTAAVADLETALSYTFLAAAAHLSIGRIQPPEMVRVAWYSAPPGVDLAAALDRALGREEDVAGALAGLAPQAAGYTRLRQALARYRDLAARDGLPSADPIRRIELNMERWRWTGDPGGRYVLVNIPDFRLSVIEDGNTVLTMKVIVGKAHRKTPVFSDLMTQVVLNPPWNIPDSIAAGEIAPRLLRDPAYLRRKGYQIRRRDRAIAPAAPGELDEAEIRQLGKRGSPYRLVQPPGADNALGRFKFVFPNQFDVYLHDTPAGSLFARSERDFSHGCIRLERPAALAAYLLDGDPRWPPRAIDAALASGRTVTIPLRRPLPVHILYRTAWVDPDGTLEFRPDVYRHDAWLAAALAAETPLWDDLAALRR